MAKAISKLAHHGDTEDTERKLVGLSGGTDKPTTVSLFEARKSIDSYSLPFRDFCTLCVSVVRKQSISL
jgi:hypothetical protein